MESCNPRHVSLKGREIEIFNIVSSGCTPEQWAEWLRVPLEHAAARGNFHLFKSLLEAGAGAQVGWRGCHGRTMLDAAAVGGNAGVVSALIIAGGKREANVVSIASGRSALYTAVVGGHEDAAKKLLLAGADANFKDPIEKCYVLHRAVRGGHGELVNYLLMSGARVGSFDKKRNNPIHVAAAGGHEGIVSTLLEKGALKDAPGEGGDTPLVMACEHSHLAVVETLLAAGANPNVRLNSDYYPTPLALVSSRGHIGILKELVRHGAALEARASHRMSALGCASYHAQADAVDALIDAGADVDYVNHHMGCTALGLACTGDYSHDTADAIRVVATLLQRGARVNHGQARSMPLLVACSLWPLSNGVDELVDLLLRWGANEKVLDTRGETLDQVIVRRINDLGFVSQSYSKGREELQRVRVLLARAPADRVWRRRSWLVILRSRSLVAKKECPGGNSMGGKGAVTRNSEERSSKVGKVDGCGGVSDDSMRRRSGERVVGANGSGGGGGGDWCLSQVVAQLVSLGPEEVFRKTMGYL